MQLALIKVKKTAPNVISEGIYLKNNALSIAKKAIMQTESHKIVISAMLHV